MSLPVWPASLPPLASEVGSGGTDALLPPVVETEMDDGPARVRRKSLTVFAPFKMALELTSDTLPPFQAFVRDTLNGGAKRFTGPVSLPDGSFGTRTCRIKGSVSVSYRGPFTPVVSFTLVVWDW